MSQLQAEIKPDGNAIKLLAMCTNMQASASHDEIIHAVTNCLDPFESYTGLFDNLSNLLKFQGRYPFQTSYDISQDPLVCAIAILTKRYWGGETPAVYLASSPILESARQLPETSIERQDLEALLAPEKPTDSSPANTPAVAHV